MMKDEPNVLLNISDFSSVQCVLKNPAALTTLKSGDYVTIKGKCGQEFENIVLKNCVLN